MLGEARSSPRDFQSLAAGLIEESHFDVVTADVEIDLAAFLSATMGAIVVHDDLVVDIDHRPIVGIRVKGVLSRIFDKKLSDEA